MSGAIRATLDIELLPTETLDPSWRVYESVAMATT